jgi:hypothetical protein
MEPTFASVTEKACECGSLESAANNPDIPISFDRELNEYHLEYDVSYGEAHDEQGKAKMMIYHCLFCGGVASHSRRELCFAQISETEKNRLHQLIEGIRSLDEVINRFGEPHEDHKQGFGMDRVETEEDPPRTENYRTLVYRSISETAEVCFVEFRPDQIHIALQGKYTGK